MSLKLQQWEMRANGFTVKFNPQSIDASGNLKGTMVHDGKTQAIEGFWHQAAQRVTFIRIVDPTQPSTIQIYTGYLNGVDALAGTFEAFSGTGATRDRSVFSWSAVIPAEIH